MATATNGRSQAYRLAISEAGYTEYVVQGTRGARVVTCRQVPTETQAPINVKFQSDAGGEAAWCMKADTELVFGEYQNDKGAARVLRPGDTIGFFQRASGSGNIILQFIEWE